MAKKEIAVKVQDLTKTFHIPLEASTGIKQKLINTLKGRKGYREFTPLNDISFEIEKGDFFGIVGRNGSGKSTLLKTIAGIYYPNKGVVTVNGTLVPFIELGVGFNPELSGRENVFLNGALLGFSRDEMEAMYDDIVDFAELHDFMDERLKNYSSGMQVRLAFSIAIRARTDILMLDEVLAVGDAAFQQKCYAYFDGLRAERRTVILVTHDMAAVERFCNKAILIEKGKIVCSGRSIVVANEYRKLFSTLNNAPAEQLRNTEESVISSVKLNVGGVGNVVKFGLPYSISVSLMSCEAIDSGIISIGVSNSQGVNVFSAGSGEGSPELSLKKGNNTLVFDVEENNLNDDQYSVSIIIDGLIDGRLERIYENANVGNFQIVGNIHRKDYLTHPKVRFGVIK